MKRALHLTLSAALIILICLPSCTKPEKQIVGKWIINYAKFDGYEDEDAEGEVWTFKENGKFRGYMVFDNKKIRSTEKEGGDIDCNWYIDGNELVLKGGDLEYSESGSGWSSRLEIVITMDIEKLDKEELILSGKMKIEDSYTEDGYTDYDSEVIKVAYELAAK